MPAGIGGASLRATIKLCLGISPRNSGVFCAGNGPAMRGALLGAAIIDIHQLRSFVEASTMITHCDPKAFYGAVAIAVATQCARQTEVIVRNIFFAAVVAAHLVRRACPPY